MLKRWVLELVIVLADFNVRKVLLNFIPAHPACWFISNEGWELFFLRIPLILIVFSYPWVSNLENLLVLTIEIPSISNVNDCIMVILIKTYVFKLSTLEVFIIAECDDVVHELRVLNWNKDCWELFNTVTVRWSTSEISHGFMHFEIVNDGVIRTVNFSPCLFEDYGPHGMDLTFCENTVFFETNDEIVNEHIKSSSILSDLDTEWWFKLIRFIKCLK